jgi:hypothetical protein
MKISASLSVSRRMAKNGAATIANSTALEPLRLARKLRIGRSHDSKLRNAAERDRRPRQAAGAST